MTFDVLLNGMFSRGLFDYLLQYRGLAFLIRLRNLFGLFICEFCLLQNSNSRLFWDTRDELFSNCFEKRYKLWSEP